MHCRWSFPMQNYYSYYCIDTGCWRPLCTYICTTTTSDICVCVFDLHWNVSEWEEVCVMFNVYVSNTLVRYHFTIRLNCLEPSILLMLFDVVNHQSIRVIRIQYRNANAYNVQCNRKYDLILYIISTFRCETPYHTWHTDTRTAFGSALFGNHVQPVPCSESCFCSTPIYNIACCSLLSRHHRCVAHNKSNICARMIMAMQPVGFLWLCQCSSAIAEH